jgi:5-methylcytosine-specific restriction protein A
MPNAAKRICSHPGCLTICQGSRCERHKREQHTNTTKNRSGDPFYSSKAWRQMRGRKLRANPLCECDECKATGAIVAASRVDHIKPRTEAPELSLVWSNLRSMSEAHHNRHTARTRRKASQSGKF